MSDERPVRTGGHTPGRGRARRALRRPDRPQLRVLPGGAPPAPAPDHVPDAELFTRIAAGDEDAFAEIYSRYFHELYDYAARVTRDRAAAADVVQTVFATAWERARRGEQIRSPRAWLYRLARNAGIDELRRRRWTAVSEGDHDFDFTAVEDAGAPDPAQAAVEQELSELVWSTAETLRPDEYALLDLHVRRELAPEELAEELGITTGALYTRLSRLRRSFEDALTVSLLKRRDGADCAELADTISALGPRADEPDGRRLLAAHIRDCPTCQGARRRYVTAEALLAGLALVPLTPATADAIWAKLCALLGLGAGAAAAGAASHGAAQHRGISGSVAAHPIAAAAVAATLAVAAGLGVWVARDALTTPAARSAAHDPSRVWSPSHTAGRRSSDNRIDIAWSRQPVAAAYSVLWSRLPRQEPDAVPDLPGRATGTTSPTLAPGRWYFHLRTESRGGAWTHTVHLGPFVIVPRTAAAAPASGSAGAGTGSGNGADTASGGASAATQGSAPAPAGATPTTPSTPPAGGGASSAARDSTPPTGQSIEIAGGRYYRTLAVPLDLKRGSDTGSGVDPASGVVQRSSAGLADGACEGWSTTWTTVALHGSADTAVANGRCYRYRYRVSDRAGNRSSFSAPSAVAAVDTSPPARLELSLSEDEPDTYADAATLFYRPAGDGGTFAVAATSVDAGSGVARIDFPGLAGGMKPTTTTSRTAPPYRVAYTWSTGASEADTHVVTVQDRAGNTALATFTIVPDAAPPAGLSAALAGGPWFTTTSVPLVVSPGSDTGSGEALGSVTVERDRAPLAEGSCGAFPSTWATVALRDGADPSVESGSCYRYRLTGADNVGNPAASPPTGEARIDTTPPSPPRLTVTESSDWLYPSAETLFYRPGEAILFKVEAAAADRESGIASVSFPSIAGATGGGVDGTPPYTAAYDAGAGLTATGKQPVVVRNRAGLTARVALEPQPDGAGPTGMSVQLSSEPWPTGSVVLVVDAGTDAGSGVDPDWLLVERDTAPLTGARCGTYPGAWTTVKLDGKADTSVVGGHCYRYRITVADNVGNKSAVSDPSGDARIPMSANVSFFSGGGGHAGWLPQHSGIQLTVPDTGAYAGITLHHFNTDSAPSTPPTFVTDNYAAGSPRFVIEFSGGAELFGYPSQFGSKWEVAACSSVAPNVSTDYPLALGALQGGTQGDSTQCGGKVTAVYIVADGSSGVFPETDTISSIQYDDQQYID